ADRSALRRQHDPGHAAADAAAGDIADAGRRVRQELPRGADLHLPADVRAGDPDADAVDHAVQDAVLDVWRAADEPADHHHTPAARRLRRAGGVRDLLHR